MATESGEPTSTRPPQIGRYRLLRTLGRGAMGVVYLGYDEAIDRQVAIKTIHRTLLEGEDSAEWLERFRREVRAAGRCLHHNIVTVFEFAEEKGIPYIVMEYVQGRELRDYLKDRQPLPLANAVAVIVQVLHALHHAHASGVVHRDIKPGNIILLSDSQVKVSDFGIARVEAISGMTQQGMTVGTPAYMAPEQFSGLEADRRADIYATGVVLFETLTGSRPFVGRGASELMYKVLNDPPPLATTLNPRLPAELDAVLNKALAKAPDDRFQSAGEFIAILENLRLVEREVMADGSTLIRVAPVPTPELPANALSGWDAALLTQVERLLTEVLGPVARVLIRRTAQQASSSAELVQQLAAAIPNEPERLLFQRRMRGVMGGTLGGSISRTVSGGSGPGSQMSASLGSFDQATLETARQKLATYLGPIAKVLVKQAAAKARTPQELYQRLAEHIPTANERNAFLKHISG